MAAMNPGAGPSWSNPNATLNQTTNTSATLADASDFSAPLSTLDEPVMETIMRDVRAVGVKLKVVLLPMDRTVSMLATVLLCFHEFNLQHALDLFF